MGHKEESRIHTSSSQRDGVENWELEEVLEQVLSQLNNGENLEEILAHYPDQADILRPMVLAVQKVRNTPLPAPNPVARRAGKERLLAAVEAKRNQQIAEALDEALARLAAGATVEAVLAGMPAWADDLRPLLMAARAVENTPRPIPDMQKKQAGRERLMEAVARRQQAPARVAEPRRETSEPSLHSLWPAPSVFSGKSFEKALDEALILVQHDIELEAILERYPDHAAKLQPLLEVAAKIRQLPEPQPAEAAYVAGRKRVVKAALERRQALKENRSTARPSLSGMFARFMEAAPHLRRAGITVVLLVAMIIGGFSVTHVAADSLPNSRLYPIKRFKERVQLVITPSSVARARLYLQFSQERLREAEILARETGELNVDLLSEMLHHNDQFLGDLKNIAPEQQEALLAEGERVFYQQRKVLTHLNQEGNVLSDVERARLVDFVGETGDDQAIAEEVLRDLDLVPLIPTPKEMEPTKAAPKPPPTTVPVEVEPVKQPTVVPPTKTVVLPTPTEVQVETGLEIIRPDQRVLPTVTPTPTATDVPAPEVPVEQPPPAEPPPAQPVQPPAQPPPAEPPPVEPPPPTPEPEIVQPPLPIGPPAEGPPP